MKKFSGLHRYLINTGIIKERDVIEPSLTDFSNLYTVHTKRYSDGVWNGNLSKKEIRRMGLPWSKGLAIRSRLAVQGTINASIMALQDGMSGNLAGGTHHAMADGGEGFCVYNDVAVAIRVLKQAKWVQRVLVIDCDVHQGNGTADIFKDDADVYTFSIHGQKNYPFKKPPSTFDIGLPDKTGDAEYLSVLEKSLEKIFNEFNPDLVYYLAGIDPLETDHFGRLSLSLKGLEQRERLVIEETGKRDLPLVLLLSGGYAPTLDQTVEAHSLLYKTGQYLMPKYY
jgi:acetoin utilization deacetylase AcuC-like enzyme